MKILVTGSAGFIGGFFFSRIIRRGPRGVCVGKFYKDWGGGKNHDENPKYRLVQGDAKDVALIKDLLRDCDHFVAGAAMIGGISYFHELAYDLLAENERIIAATFDAAISAHRDARLRR